MFERLWFYVLCGGFSFIVTGTISVAVSTHFNVLSFAPMVVFAGSCLCISSMFLMLVSTILRVSYIGITSVFDTDEASSNLATRANFLNNEETHEN